MNMFPKKKEKQKDEHQSESPSTSSPANDLQGQAAEQPEQKTVKLEQPVEEPRKQVEQLRKQLEDLRKEKDDIFAKLQRVAADYDNYQKRSARQMADSITYEKDKIIKVLLPVLDDFERALAHAENVDSVAEGVKLVYEHLKGVLRSQGVEQIESTGEKFDPAHHQAITQTSVAGKEDGLVLEELQKGYKLNGRVIRASRVVVNKAPVPEVKQPTDEDETMDTQ
jgi:molecular chaperone GrpE